MARAGNLPAYASFTAQPANELHDSWQVRLADYLDTEQVKVALRLARAEGARGAKMTKDGTLYITTALQ